MEYPWGCALACHWLCGSEARESAIGNTYLGAMSIKTVAKTLEWVKSPWYNIMFKEKNPGSKSLGKTAIQGMTERHQGRPEESAWGQWAGTWSEQGLERSVQRYEWSSSISWMRGMSEWKGERVNLRFPAHVNSWLVRRRKKMLGSRNKCLTY